MDRREVQEMLNFDPLDTAERITGRGGDDIGILGLALAVGHNLRKNDTLREMGDTTLSNDLPFYLSVLADLGFVEVLRDEFVCPAEYGDPERTEYFAIHAHPDGFLLRFDTYYGQPVILRLSLPGRFARIAIRDPILPISVMKIRRVAVSVRKLRWPPSRSASVSA